MPNMLSAKSSPSSPRIGAGVAGVPLAGVILPEVILGDGWLADDFDAFLRLLRIKTQNETTVPGAEIDSLVRPGNQCSRARPLRGVEMPRLAGVGVHLHQEHPSADLVEIEMERLAAASVVDQDAAHQTAFAHGNPKRLEFPGVGRCRGENRAEAQKDQ
jgi:hypothetical protein